jgi:hypothetical protein
MMSRKANDWIGFLMGLLILGLAGGGQAAAAAGMNYAEGRLTLSAKQTPLTQVLEELHRLAGIDIYAARGLSSAQVSVDVRDEPLEDALKTILRQYNYAAIYVKEGDGFRITALKLFKEGEQGGEVVPLFTGSPAAVYADSDRHGETRTVFVSSSRDVTIQGEFQKRGLLVPSQMTVAQESAGPLPEGLHIPWVAMQADIQTRESEQFQQLLYLQKQLEGAKSDEERRIASQLYTDQVAKFQLQKRANVNKVEALKMLNSFQGLSSR